MAARFWVGGGSSSNWGATVNTNWSLTSGGANNVAVPTSADDVTFNGAGASGNTACVVDTSNRVCKTLTFAIGYTQTVTMTFNISVSGSINIGSTGNPFAGAGLLRMIAAGTWTTNAITLSVPIEIGGTTTFTCTLADNLTTSAAMTWTNTTSTIFSGAHDIYCASLTISGSQTITLSGYINSTGLLTISDANVLNGSSFSVRTQGLTVTGALTGSSTIEFKTGGGTWQGAAACSMSVTINLTSGTLTLSGTILYAASGTPTLTYAAGTVVTTGSTLSIASSCTLNTNGMSWNNITITAAATLTLLSQLTATGTLTLPNANVSLISGAFRVGTLTNTSYTASRTVTLSAGTPSGIQNVVTGSLVNVGTTAAIKQNWVSQTPGTSSFLVLEFGATQDLGWAFPTDIDSSQYRADLNDSVARRGQTIFTFRGTITTSTNWSNTLPVNVWAGRPMVVKAAASY